MRPSLVGSGCVLYLFCLFSSPSSLLSSFSPLYTFSTSLPPFLPHSPSLSSLSPSLLPLLSPPLLSSPLSAPTSMSGSESEPALLSESGVEESDAQAIASLNSSLTRSILMLDIWLSQVNNNKQQQTNDIITFT